MNKMMQKIRAEEGFSNTMYKCPADYWTIGYGFNLESSRMPMEVAELWLTINLRELDSKLMTHDWYAGLNQDRKYVIMDMAYQIGINGLLKFRKMISALRDGLYDDAVVEMLDSKWAKQTPHRALRNAKAMASGELEI